MTTLINSTEAKFYINRKVALNLSADLVVTSQYSQLPPLTIQPDNWTVTLQNSRFMEITAQVPATFKDEHQNGFYTWSIDTYSDIVKVITQPGGGTGEVGYISSNENREADVYFRPNY